ncbi:peptidase S8/S53 domain-containing protein [Mycotypha africana]|uniref:peptidase S8/S53 domain-containing protein n=1 Tax=Mycotypha africana TaxID=64632 RepID=UPI002300DD18|nr:peptidase S8/S53 domain-containing protein [Mycotypha africana]KAI8988582.1 peptidase S8/S53 domain-containing protein [Mycotypha africana]
MLVSLTEISLFLYIIIFHTLGDKFVVGQRDQQQNDFDQSALQDTDDYIIVFKPTINSKHISNQLQLLKAHQVINNNDGTTNYTLTALTNGTLNSNSPFTSTRDQKYAYNSIGKFRWYSAKFHTQAIDQLLNTGSTYINTTTNITFNTDIENAIHYWVKDASFSLQEFIQTDPPSWGLDRIDQRLGTDGHYSFASGKGKNVKIYLMDSGIREDHEDIKGRVTIGKTVVGDPNNPSDSNGHGTFVAGVCCGTKYGVAKEAEIVSVKTLDDEGNGRLSDLLIGLQWIVDQHLAESNAKSIVNLSLGSYYSQATNDAIEEAISLGIHFSIAAGNYGEDACRYSPGSAPGAITVGAIDEDDSVSFYSNFGKCVDIFAPGTNINSIWSASTTATRTLTGTSMAAPHVAGAMAIFLSEANYTPIQLANYIKRVSSLITEDFTVNNTDTFYNENKTVIDNAIDIGYKVRGQQDKKTRVNILFTHPNDSQPFWIYGQTLSDAVFTTPLLSRITFLHVLIPLSILTFYFM